MVMESMGIMTSSPYFTDLIIPSTTMHWSRVVGSYSGMHHDPTKHAKPLWKISMDKFGRLKLHYGKGFKWFKGTKALTS